MLMLVAAMVAAGMLKAEVTLTPLVSDGMVVQRNLPVAVWGTASPGETVDVRGSGPGYQSSATVVADAKGQWRVDLEPMPAGDGYSITVNDRRIDDVLSGDVLLCSGQSNMELPVRRVAERFADEVGSYANRLVRQFAVPQEIDFHNQQDMLAGGSWVATTPEAALNFSALGYFLGKELNELENVPIGIVNASWGGTPIESWMSFDALQRWPKAVSEWRLWQDDGYRARFKKLEGENFSRWNQALYQGDPGRQASTPWWSIDYNDTAWPEVDLTSTHWASDGLNPVNGSHWLRKTIDLPASVAGQSAVLRLGCIVDADSVYVNGQFVGATGYQYPPRFYRVPVGVLVPGRNVVTVRLISQKGGARFVPEKPYRLEVGEQQYSLEGKWRYCRGAVMPQAPGMEFYCYKPTVLYNAMIHPLAPMRLRGVVWYQGESNVERRNQYSDQLQAMISDWRSTFADSELPFYIVELAGYLHPSDTGGQRAWAEMRAAQADAAKATANAYLIPNADLGEWNDIHPLDKKTLAERIANAINNRQ